jgi:hypothetical protein
MCPHAGGGLPPDPSVGTTFTALRGRLDLLGADDAVLYYYFQGLQIPHRFKMTWLDVKTTIGEENSNTDPRNDEYITHPIPTVILARWTRAGPAIGTGGYCSGQENLHLRRLAQIKLFE